MHFFIILFGQGFLKWSLVCGKLSRLLKHNIYIYIYICIESSKPSIIRVTELIIRIEIL